MTFRWRYRWLFSVSLLIALAVAWWHPGDGDDVWGAVEGQLLDLRFKLRGPIPAPDSVAIIGIDDRDIATAGVFPLPRAVLGRAVETAVAGGAAAVVLDLLLIEPRTGDDALAAALAGAPAAVLAVARAGAAAVSDPSFALIRSGFNVVVGAPEVAAGPPMGPHPGLARDAVLGHVNVEPDPDGNLRRIPAAVVLDAGDGPVWVPGLALAAAARSAPDLGPLILTLPQTGRSGSVEGAVPRMTLDRRGRVPLTWYGGEGAVMTVPLRDAAAADLAGRVVMIGITALGVGDRHPTPFAPRLPGVEAQATLAANLIEGRHLRRDDTAWGWDFALAIAAMVLGFHAAALDRPPLAVAAAVASIAITGTALQVAFLNGLWLDATTAALALVAGLGGGAVLRLAQNRARSANLARYQSPLLAEVLADQSRPAFDGRTQKAVALFVDVTGFTARSEADGPAATADFLHWFHGAVERAAIAHGGVVEQFAGDGAMVIFGLPQPGANDAAAALRCIQALFAEARRAPGPAVRIRVGAHCGAVRAGVVGGARQRHVTVTGDVVNTASRLQEVAKDRAAAIAVSDALLRDSGDTTGWAARLALRDLGPIGLRGRSAELHIWAGPLTEETRP